MITLLIMIVSAVHFYQQHCIYFVEIIIHFVETITYIRYLDCFAMYAILKFNRICSKYFPLIKVHENFMI